VDYIRREYTVYITVGKWSFKSLRNNDIFLTNELLIRRSQVRILPGVPYSIRA
jgi:hypothetical protein